MKKMKLMITCLFLAALSTAQPTFQWAKQLGGTSDETGNGIAIDASGNVFTTGSFKGIADFDPGASTYTLNSGSAMSDIFVSKLDASGNFVWAKSFGSTPADEGGTGIGVDASGNVYVTGTFNGTVDFDPGPGTYTLTGSASSSAFVLKLDNAGNFVWARKLGAASGVNAYALALDASANVYTTGYFTGTADLDPGVATYTVASKGSTDIYVSKLDVSGNFVWGKAMGGADIDVAYAITADASGNVYTTGNFQTTCDFDPSAATYTIASGGGADIFISKLDVNGNFVWAKSMFSSTGSNSGGRSIKTDASNNVYTGGFFGGTVDFNPAAATYTLSAAGSDGFISKLDAGGNFVWGKQLKSNNSCIVYALTLDASANVYTTGTYDGIVDFDPGAATNTVTATGGDDAYILKLDASGNFVWAQDLGGPASYSNVSEAIALNTSSGNIYLTGQFDATVDFNFGAGTTNLTPFGTNSFDVFVEMIGQSGFCTAPAAPVNTTPVANQTLCSGNTTTLTVSSANTVNWYATATSTTALATGILYTTPVLAAGNYTYYAEASTCTVSASRTAITLTVNATPTITVNSGSICNGSSFTITANGAATYTISGIATGSTTVVMPSVNITYNVTGTSALGCISASAAVSSVTVNAAPTLTVNSGSICNGSSFTITPSGASTYTVSGGSSIVSPTTTTNYSVTGTSSFGCVSTSPAVSTVTVNAIPLIAVNSGSMCNGSSFTLTPSGATTYTISGGSAVVSPTSTTSYSVTGTSAFGCSGSNTAIGTVTVNTRPIISVNSGSVCSGTSFTMVASGASTYNYAGGSAVVTPSISSSIPSVVAIYTVTGVSAQGCVSANTASCSLTVYSLPTVVTVSNASVICSGQSAILTASGANTYTWSTGALTTTATVTPTITTVYTVTGKTSSSGCTNMASITQSVSACTSIAETSETVFSVYPNPTNGDLTISSGAGFQNLQVEIVDAAGRIIYSQHFEDQQQEITLSLNDYTKGIYFAKITDGAKQTWKKIILQ